MLTAYVGNVRTCALRNIRQGADFGAKIAVGGGVLCGRFVAVFPLGIHGGGSRLRLAGNVVFFQKGESVTGLVKCERAGGAVALNLHTQNPCELPLSGGGESCIAVVVKCSVRRSVCANVDDVVDVDADVFKAVLFCGSNIDAGVGFELAPAVGEKAGAERLVPEAGSLLGAVKAFAKLANKRLAGDRVGLLIAMGHLHINFFINIRTGECV